MRSRAAALSLLLTTALLGSVAPASPAVAATADESGRLVLLLDSSGSMKEPAAGGGTKIEAAKSALGDVVRQLPDSAEVGIRVFGAKVFSRKDAGACTDTQNVVPVGPLDRDRLTSAVKAYKPYGETPIGNALKGAARDLGAVREGEKRTIVLLSDGEPTCAPDPCVVARQLRKQGIDLRINVVGLDVSGKARGALQCVARAGGGRYFDASSAAELTESMVQVSVRALRQFSLSGDPVTGGTSTADPAAVEPGDYVDETLPEKAPRYYLVDRPENGTVTASAVMRPADNDNTLDALRISLLTPDGTSCANDFTTSLNLLGLQSIVGSAAVFGPFVNSPGDTCLGADQLLVQVDFNGPATPFSLRIRSYPEVSNLDELPGGADMDDKSAWERPVALEGAGTAVIGGASFEDAPELEAGKTYADTLRPREQLIYKTRVAYGQTPRMTARLETDVRAARLQGLLGVQVQAKAFSPLGRDLGFTTNSETDVRPTGRYNGDDPVTLTQALPPVRVRNLESYDSRLNQAATDGFYYFTLEMGSDSEAAGEEFAAPVRLAVAVEGQEEGVPEYDGEVQGQSSASPSPSPSSSATADGDDAPASSSESVEGWALPWGLVAGVAGVLLVALALAGAFLLGRRGRG